MNREQSVATPFFCLNHLLKEFELLIRGICEALRIAGLHEIQVLLGTYNYTPIAVK